MCDIWKGNHNLRQLSAQDVEGLLETLRRFGTRQVLMSGGEALLNPNFFQLCALLKKEGLRITLLSTGLLIGHHADQLLRLVDDIIVSLDGDESLHDQIRNIPGAFRKLKEGVKLLHSKRPEYRITARTVIHRLNFKGLAGIVRAALDMGLDQISFLPADVTSAAFNRAESWDAPRQQEILPTEEELPEVEAAIEALIRDQRELFESGYIAESPGKFRKISQYYTASYGLNPFPYKKCNAPWVSAVIEADGAVRPCFFLPALGNIHEQTLDSILNGPEAIHFRKNLDMDENETCKRCVCSLHLSPRTKLKG
jgi:MoaA/NifB/PqqE/SkfB family radical SAM enzyme